MKNKKIAITITGIIGAIGIFLPYIERLINGEFTFCYFISAILVGMSITLRRLLNHRNDEIKKIFENATEENKEKLYNYAKEIEKNT